MGQRCERNVMAPQCDLDDHKDTTSAPTARDGLRAVANSAQTAMIAVKNNKKQNIKAAQERPKDGDALLDKTEGVSPFAPKRFPNLPEIKGVSLAAAAAGVKYENRLDVMLAKIEGPHLAVAGVFTRSQTRSAPVLWCEERLHAHAAAPSVKEGLGILVNAGNANAFTGSRGVADVETTATAAAKALNVPRENIYIASTGIIGELLPADRINAQLGKLARDIAPQNWESAARAIMTTDTFPKAASAEVMIDGVKIRIAGFAKGSGMIAPDMATMLSYIFTDAHIAQPLLQRIISELTETTFNAITVDGDTSTSDTVIVAATGAAANAQLCSPKSAGYTAFRRALKRVMLRLAQWIVKDGEGCTKFVEVRVEGAQTRRSARVIGRAIANSPLVKTAIAGEDANWGRVVMAVGKSGEPADRDKLAISFGPHLLAEQGWRAEGYDENAVSTYMKNAELLVRVNVGVRNAAASVWTCDLSHNYIAINAAYRS